MLVLPLIWCLFDANLTKPVGDTSKHMKVKIGCARTTLFTYVMDMSHMRSSPADYTHVYMDPGCSILVGNACIFTLHIFVFYLDRYACIFCILVHSGAG